MIKYPVICTILLLVLFDLTKPERDICEENEPCQAHGGCFLIEETSQPSFLSTKCVCSRGYSGRWCQFNDEVTLGNKDKKTLTGRPGSPRILTQLSTISYERSYKLSWEKPSGTPVTSILYYALRYRMVGESTWKNVEEIVASQTQTTYSYVFQSLFWDFNYEVEIYAGSSQGVGRPATGIITRPKIEYPEIIYVSKDRIGDDAVLEGTRFHLRCKALGKPHPTLSWFLNDDRLLTERNISVTGENLTVLSANVQEHQGVYRCVATNKWGSVMSRRVQVNVAAPVKFLKPRNHHKSKAIIKQVAIGMSAYFNCPPHTSMSLRMPHAAVFPEIRHTSLFPGISYKWGNRYKNSSKDFDIKTSERVWVTTKGVLVFRVFKQEDVELIDKTGIRCIVEQRTSAGRSSIISNVFRVRIGKYFPWPGKQPKFMFLDKPRKNITLLRGESLELHCSAISKTRGNILIEWGIDTGSNKRFPNGVKTTNFGRILKYDDVQKSDSGKIECKAFKIDETGNYKRDVITARTFLNVLDRPYDVYRNLPKKISVFSSSTLRLGPFHAASSVSWYFNGKLLNNKKAYLEFDSDHFRSTIANSGIYQVDTVNGERSHTVPVYVQFIDEEIFDATVPPHSGIQHYCLPPGTFSLAEIKVEFMPSCGLNVGSNTITVTQETAWRHSSCSCKADGDFYSMVRKFDMGFDGAMFSSQGKWSWTQWSPWSHCPLYQEICGKNIFSFRRRTCFNPTTNLDGEYCSGSTKQKQRCPFIPCRKKVSSFWSQWSIWSECSNLCGPGTQSRRRMCIAPSEEACPEGKWLEKKKCVGAVCYNVQENWAEWSTWSDCSKSCGMGMRVRQRHCSTGQQCSGWSKEHIACYNFCKVTKEDEKSERNEIYSKGILYLPNAVALFAAIILTGVAVTMVIRNCHKKLNKNARHERLLQDLFYKPSLDVKRRPPSRRFHHKPDSSSSTSKGPSSSASLAPDIPSEKLPPPSHSLLASSGGIATAHSAKGSVPQLPFSPTDSGAPPPPPPPPARK